jgi:FKBP-type peptidyl-prolyl cis-trans isomerase FkpA
MISMKSKYWSPFLLLIISVAFSSCLKTEEPFDVVGQYTADTIAISKYIKDHNINAVKLSSGVFVAVTKMGKGVKAMVTNIVDVDYKGKNLSTGNVFDQGNVSTTLASLIRGWQYALAAIPEGTEATIYIPSYWAYGQAGQGSIPPNANLVFDITFNEIDYTTAEKNLFKSDTTKIFNYLKDNSIETEYDSLGLHYNITEVGSQSPDSAVINIFSKVKVKMTLKTLADTPVLIKEFNYGPVPAQGFDSRISDFMRAVNIVAPKMHPGGKATVYVPSRYGFGPNQLVDTDNSVLLQGNSNFILELEFIKVYK